MKQIIWIIGDSVTHKRLCRQNEVVRFLIILVLALCFSFSLYAQEKKHVKSYSSLSIDTINYSRPQLLEFLKNGDNHLRQFAVMQLTEQEDINDTILKMVINALGDKCEDVRFQVLAGLMRQGSGVTKFLAQELSNDTEVGEYTYHSKARNGMRRFNIKQSDLAFTALRNARSADGDALLNLYKSSSALIKKHILELLESLPIEITPALYKALSGTDIQLAITMAKALQNMGSAATEAIPKLSKLIINGKHQIRDAAARALVNIPDEGHLELRKLIHTSNTNAQSTAITIYPYDADSAILLVSQLINDPNVHIKIAALGRLQSSYFNYYYDEEEYSPRRGSSKYSEFIAALPNSVISDVTSALKSAASNVRLASISALASIALLRKEYAQTIADTLLSMLSDSDKYVRTEVIRQLANMGNKGIIPGSKNALMLIFEQLKNSKDDQADELLEVLEKIKTTGLPDKKLIDILINRCLNEKYSCDKIVSVLKSKSGWVDESIKLILEKYPDLSLINDNMFNTLISLKSTDQLYSDMLDQFLSHPKKWMRTRAAISLSDMNITSEKVLNVLEEGAKTFEGYASQDGEAADALAKVNPAGVDRIIKIVNDKKTNKKVRRALVYYSLAGVANENKMATDILLYYAKDDADFEFQEDAVWALRSVTKHPEKLKDALEHAFLAKNDKVRYAVVYTWSDAKLEPGDFINQVITDKSPEVRKLVFKLMDSLPLTDSRRISITKTAIEDDNENVSEAALEFSEKLGPEGQAIFENYVRSGKTLSYTFFKGVKHFAPLNQSMILALQSRKPNASTEIRTLIDETLGLALKDTFVDRAKLYEQLNDTSETESLNAAKALLSLNDDPWANEGIIGAVLLRTQVKNIVEEHLGVALDYLYPPDGMLMSGSMSYLPSFPWPPPAGYKRVVIPYTLFKPELTTTLGGIYNSLTGALNASDHNFEHGLFGGVPKGYALLARMEHIEENGTPLPGNARWTKEGTSNAGLLNLFGDLFFEKPGFFRLIVFAVTNDFNLIPNQRAILPDITKGSASMPAELAALPRTNQQVLALVYTFERKGKGKITAWTDGIPSAQVHLEKSGIWTNLK